jgi:hypothetical protein
VNQQTVPTAAPFHILPKSLHINHSISRSYIVSATDSVVK